MSKLVELRVRRATVDEAEMAADQSPAEQQAKFREMDWYVLEADYGSHGYRMTVTWAELGGKFNKISGASNE